MGERWLTPPAVGEMFGVDPAKVIAWIRAGELRAVNVATAVKGRPRWRIAPEALESFVLGRESRPVISPIRRRRQPAEVIQFF